MGSDKSCRVYVGNLPWRVRWQDLKDHMRQVGTVVRADVFEDETGRSKGCGVVEFLTPAEAGRAIGELNDSKLADRLIFVREDREETNRYVFGSRRGRGTFGNRNGHTKRGGPSLSRPPLADDHRGRQIFVSNLPWRTVNEDIIQCFNDCGQIESSEVHYYDDGRSRGIATVIFTDLRSAERAVELKNNFEIDGRPISVKIDA